LARGQARTIEGVLALGMVLIVHVILQTYIPSVFIVNPQMRSIGTQALVSLDESSRLGALVKIGASTSNWEPLATAMQASLPSSVNFQLQVVDARNPGQTLPGTPIRSGVLRGSIATVTYVVQIYDITTHQVNTYYLTLTVSA